MPKAFVIRCSKHHVHVITKYPTILAEILIQDTVYCFYLLQYLVQLVSVYCSNVQLLQLWAKLCHNLKIDKIVSEDFKE